MEQLQHAVPPLALDEPPGVGLPQHIPELDGIRGCAILFVLVYHVSQKLMPYEHGVAHLAMDGFSLGFVGVDVFFALSGFLITRILLGKQTEQRFYRNFYARRVLRLAPAYLLTIAIVAIVAPGNGASLLLSLVYLANFSALFHIPVGYGILWSLSVEEQFYLLWPSCIRHLSPRAMLIACCAVCGLTPFLRIAAAFSGHFDPYLPWFRFDGLAWGALLALLLTSPRSPERVRLLLVRVLSASLFLVAAGVVLWASPLKLVAASVLFAGVPMVTTGVIWFACGAPRPALAILRSRVLRFFGDLSYWMYLIHILFIYKLFDLIERRDPALVARGGFSLWLLLLALTLVLTVGSGVIVRRWIELPALRLKRKFA